ncbi:hypothetical protein EDD16DRAFT_1559605 [Pisolithus croceorrhizus]|nr:hypothetical protein EDD16DRAFT_1559605 [Pisolithus croceorrhizus]
MFSRALLIGCVVLLFDMPAALGAAVVRSSWYTCPSFSPSFTKFTALSSMASAQETYVNGVVWKGYEQQVVGYGSSDVPQPTPTPNVPKDRSVVAAAQRASSPIADTPQRLRREADTGKEPRSPMPDTDREGLMWKGREHEEAIRGRVNVEQRNVPETGAL